MAGPSGLLAMSSRGRHSKGRHLYEGRGLARLNGIGQLLLAALVAVVLAVVAIPLATGGEWRTVQTGSMEPEISPGDVVLVQPGTAVQVGDVVAFPDPLQPGRDVLHRVVDVDNTGLLVTRGDANDIADPWTIDPAEVIGTQSLAVPKLGLLVQTVSSDLGILLFLVVPALLILINESRVWFRWVRYGSAAFREETGGRHLVSRGKHLAGSHR